MTGASPAAMAVMKADMMPRVYRLSENVYAMAFRSMKLVPANFILSQAFQDQEIHQHSTVVETTSGTFGLGLARVGRALDLRVHLVSDPAIDGALRSRLELLGATVDIVQADEKGSYQVPRLHRLQEVIAATGGFWPNQYDNPLNQRSYHDVIDYVLREIPASIKHLIAAYGSGGSGTGCSVRLAERGHRVRTYAVDTPNSVLFGQPDGHRQLRGLGNSILPGNVAYDLVDEVHWIPADLAYSAACHLARNFGGLDVGPTSGAAFLVAREVAHRFRKEDVLVVFADDGERYRSTFLSRPWLEERGMLLGLDHVSPREVDHPLDAGLEWARFQWRRQSLEAVRSLRESV
jgi:S-sulfo-L-cysteine synthase (3-phospho-L-serine-dependent)